MKRLVNSFRIAPVGCVVALSLVQTVGLAQQTADASKDAAPMAPRALLDRYCVTCHNQRLKTAGLELDAIDVGNTGSRPETWEKVIRKLRMGAMPPPGAPRPDQVNYDTFASYLESSLDRVAAASPEPGRTETFHRLNRTEYRNAIRDLLALDVDVGSLLPADGADQNGFDNMAAVLSVSPLLLERYVAAARKVSRLAVGLRPTASVAETYEVPRLLLQDDRVSELLPFGSRGGLAVQHQFPADGEYLIKIRLTTNYVDYIRGLDEPHRIELRLDGALVREFTVGGGDHGNAPPASYEGLLFGSPQWDHYRLHAHDSFEVRVPIRGGPHLVSVFFPREHWEPEGVAQPRQFGSALTINGMPDENPGLSRVEIDGPLSVAAVPDTPSRRRILVCQPTAKDQRGCAKRILSTLARRAYRRPVTDDDLVPLLRFYDARRQGGAGFDDGIQFALERLLTDPEFLFRIERDPDEVASGAAYRVTALELASRLSFFLWSSIPDDELLDAAARGTLNQQEVLATHVRRMIADPRSNALVQNFAGQWLLLRDVQSAYPDPGLYPEFDDNLRQAFRQETELFIESQLRADRSVVELLTANYTFLNERLARHYRIPNVYGSSFRKVTLPPGEPRRGLLGHGSVLTVTSYPNRTSPVLRGKWLLTNILGSPPPEPPPDVPALPDRGDDGKPASIRERMERHRKNPACATCHAPMDPLGFALEHYDPIGGWRARGDADTAIDANGVLPDGSTFDGLEGLRTTLLEQHRDTFVQTLTEKLLMYALGRGVESHDMPVVRQISRHAADRDYAWSSIILGIVTSTPFQMRRAQQ